MIRVCVAKKSSFILVKIEVLKSLYSDCSDFSESALNSLLITLCPLMSVCRNRVYNLTRLPPYVMKLLILIVF
jgi:hypothetical protein